LSLFTPEKIMIKKASKSVKYGIDLLIDDFGNNNTIKKF